MQRSKKSLPVAVVDDISVTTKLQATADRGSSDDPEAGPYKFHIEDPTEIHTDSDSSQLSGRWYKSGARGKGDNIDGASHISKDTVEIHDDVRQRGPGLDAHRSVGATSAVSGCLAQLWCLQSPNSPCTRTRWANRTSNMAGTLEHLLVNL